MLYVNIILKLKLKTERILDTQGSLSCCKQSLIHAEFITHHQELPADKVHSSPTIPASRGITQVTSATSYCLQSRLLLIKKVEGQLICSRSPDVVPLSDQTKSSQIQIYSILISIVHASSSFSHL